MAVTLKSNKACSGNRVGGSRQISGVWGDFDTCERRNTLWDTEINAEQRSQTGSPQAAPDPKMCFWSLVLKKHSFLSNVEFLFNYWKFFTQIAKPPPIFEKLKDAVMLGYQPTWLQPGELGGGCPLLWFPRCPISQSFPHTEVQSQCHSSSSQNGCFINSPNGLCVFEVLSFICHSCMNVFEITKLKMSLGVLWFVSLMTLRPALIPRKEDIS